MRGGRACYNAAWGVWLRMLVANAIGRLIINPAAITQALTKYQIYAKFVTTADWYYYLVDDPAGPVGTCVTTGRFLSVHSCTYLRRVLL